MSQFDSGTASAARFHGDASIVGGFIIVSGKAGGTAVDRITTGKLVHQPASASLGEREGALWLEVDTALGQHVNLCLIERRPIEIDGLLFAVREARTA